MNKNILMPSMALGGMLLLTGCEASQSTLDAANGYLATHEIDQQCVDAVENSEYIRPTDTAVVQACESVSLTDRVELRRLYDAEEKSKSEEVERGFLFFVGGLATTTLISISAKSGRRR
jgi:hypothetical protein